MRFFNAAEADHREALRVVNESFAGNIKFFQLEKEKGATREGGERWRVRLSTIKTREKRGGDLLPGNRIGSGGKAVPFACYHAWGVYIRALPASASYIATEESEPNNFNGHFTKFVNVRKFCNEPFVQKGLAYSCQC